MKGSIKNRKILLRKYKADQNVLANVWHAGTFDPSKYSTWWYTAMPRIGLEIQNVPLTQMYVVFTGT